MPVNVSPCKRAFAMAAITSVCAGPAMGEPGDILFERINPAACVAQVDGAALAPAPSLLESAIAHFPVLASYADDPEIDTAILVEAIASSEFCRNPTRCSPETRALWSIKQAFWSLADAPDTSEYALRRRDGEPVNYDRSVNRLIRDVLLRNPNDYAVSCPLPPHSASPENTIATQRATTLDPEAAAPPTPEPAQTEPAPDEQTGANRPRRERPDGPIDDVLPEWLTLARNTQELLRPYHKRSHAVLAYNANEVNGRRRLDVEMALGLPLAFSWSNADVDPQNDDDASPQNEPNTRINGLGRSFIEYRRLGDNDNDSADDINNLAFGLGLQRAVESRTSACSNPLSPRKERYSRWRAESEVKWITDDQFDSSQGLVSISGVYEPCLDHHWNVDPAQWLSSHTPLDWGQFKWSAEYTLSLDASEVADAGDKERLLEVNDFQRWGGDVRWVARWVLPNDSAWTARANYIRRIGFSGDDVDVDLLEASLDYAPEANSRIRFGVDFIRGPDLISLEQQERWRVGIGLRN